MKGGVNEFVKIAMMAQKSPVMALEFSQSLFDNFYRCKSFAVTAFYTSNQDKRLKILAQSLEDGLKVKHRLDRGMAIVWPLRQLAEMRQDHLVQKELKILLDDVKPYAGTTEYLDLMNLLVGALAVGCKENFAILFQTLKIECEACHHNKKDILLSQIIPVIHKIDERMSRDLLFLMEGETPRKKAEKRIIKEANLTIKDYYLDLQFKDFLKNHTFKKSKFS